MTLRVVISGVNLIEGGPLKVFKDCISAFSALGNVSLICLVNNQSLFSDFTASTIRFIQFPDVKSSWLNRVRFEYFYSRKLSLELQADIWLSMHDVTPRVLVGKQYTYCHNPSPFYAAGFRDFLLDKKFFLFAHLYRYLYRINIKSNAAVIVQQEWMASFFKKQLNVPRVWVARPQQVHEKMPKANVPLQVNAPVVTLFYPAFARSFKNFEVVFRALKLLGRSSPCHLARIKMIVTITGEENGYSKWLKREFADVSAIVWAGHMSRAEVDTHYHNADVVIFPSRLETWGLPITEAKTLGKPLLVADLPYAHETVGEYGAVGFFDPTDAAQLAERLKAIVDGEPSFGPAQHLAVEADVILNSWEELVSKIMEDARFTRISP